ncbi:MRC1-like domain-containing protein [Apodospora peruviana]|uniref:MRC1-like domain-containing protein n=1 Tax=Apodospora peruviana TaxID=516989 RepID=A0AAE0IK82_9PEZI|nr:MRC1-like domain-containing protein [Apodospora peruviana]
MASSRSSPSNSPARVSRAPTPSSPHVTTHPDLVALLESSDEDEAILRPRGRFAARMHAQAAKELQSESEDEEDDATDVLKPANIPKKTLENDREASLENQDEYDDDDEVVKPRPRKLQSRRQRSTMPESRPQEPAGSSPGLFVSPSKPRSPTAGSDAGHGSDSDDGLPSTTNLAKNARLLAFNAKKRQEREAREAEEARRRAERLAAQQPIDDDIMSVDEEDSNISDDDGGRRLTQSGAPRPTRKASKKALEEMNRETQRLTRSLQLAHEAKVKKKITKATLFERFNFKPQGGPETPSVAAALPPSSSRPASPASHRHTDAEDKDSDTPPSSPPAPAVNAPGSEKDARLSHSESAGLVAADDLIEQDENGELPTLEAALDAATAKKHLDKGKGKATAANLEVVGQQPQALPKVKRNLRVKLPPIQANTVSLTLDDDDDDDDLKIQTTHKSKLDAIFARVPVNQAKESRPLQNLRKLAHIDDPERKVAPPSGKNSNLQKQPPAMTSGELEMSLLQRARLQAKIERDRHLELLRSKGIHVQTTEEREKEIAQVEDIVARARKEAEELMQREREDAKADRKARREAGEADPLGWDDSDDSGDDYQEDVEEADIELSGSEDEEDAQADGAEDVAMDAEDEEEEKDGHQADPAGVMFDDLAESAEESDGEAAEQQSGDQDSDDEEVVASRQPARHRPKKLVTIISDDEDEEEEVQQHVEATPRPKTKFFKSPSALNAGSPQVPTSVLRSATKTFIPGLPVPLAGPAGLGLTQIFAGTMDDSQPSGSMMGSPSQPMPTFEQASQPIPNFGAEKFPDSNFSQTAQEVGDDMILDSQPTGHETQEPETQGVQLGFSQSQMHGFDSLLQENHDATQTSELIEPTQDGGFQNFSPLKKRFVEPPTSTVETVKVDESQGDTAQAESPLVRRTGKLRRKADLLAAAAAAPAGPTASAASDHKADGMKSLETDEFGFGTVAASATAFAVMKEAAAKQKKAKAEAAFDKKKSKARDMVEDQAEESEDEYAGLGGADGEDDSDDDDQSVKEMLDDETKTNEVDERKLAAFYADRERAADEKQVDKLFHDITSGMLRRKRNGDWDDLSDEDDRGEARRRAKRRQFAKMQRALFADERISKVAENPRNQAFLRTIEDHGSDDDMDFIFAPPPLPAAPSQEASQELVRQPEPTTIPDSQPQQQQGVTAAAAPPENPRRTKEGKRPSNIGDIRESLSNLLDEPSLNSSSVIPATELGSDDDDDEAEIDETTAARPASSRSSSNKENRNPRRRVGGHAHIVDRITLKRNSSSNVSTSTSDRLAFAATAPSSSSSNSGFKVPALLRRATTNNSLVSGTATSSSNLSTTTSTTAGGGDDANQVKRSTTTTSKRSGINYFARENERRAALAENERRREAKKWKGAEGRSKVVGGLFGAGKFE